MKHKYAPESLMMTFGYKPSLSEGAVKPPVFQTSTFAFRSAEEGKAYFELAYGLREKATGEECGLIYSRINNPNLEILENRLCLWEETDDCAVFQSGMSAITTVMLEFLKPGDVLLYSSPTYGGTDHFIHHYLKDVGVICLGFSAEDSAGDMIQRVIDSGQANRLSLVYAETPANPTNDLIDIKACREVADFFSTQEKYIPVAVDNTFMGPLWSKPMRFGADLVIYSATKYLGGHSDLIAGAVLGHYSLVSRIRVLRTFLGNMAGPQTCWLLLRSLETLKLRMEKQMENAVRVADFLKAHPAIQGVDYLGHLKPGDNQYKIYKEQYTSPGAMVAFYIHGGEKEAFAFLNHLKLVKLAVSLGSTESLAQHPSTMTHAGVDPALKQKLGITDSLIRLSVGVENYLDLIHDIKTALEHVHTGQMHL